MANNIKGNGDGKNGENETYIILGRGLVDRKTLVKEIKKGNHPNFHIYKTGEKEYVRANPDSKNGNNVNR